MPGTFRIGTIAGIDIDIHVSWMALPTGYATSYVLFSILGSRFPLIVAKQASEDVKKERVA